MVNALYYGISIKGPHGSRNEKIPPHHLLSQFMHRQHRRNHTAASPWWTCFMAPSLPPNDDIDSYNETEEVDHKDTLLCSKWVFVGPSIMIHNSNSTRDINQPFGDPVTTTATAITTDDTIINATAAAVVTMSADGMLLTPLMIIQPQSLLLPSKTILLQIIWCRPVTTQITMTLLLY